MALISDLVSAIAEVEGVPDATVSLAARYAREAGFLSQGARGRNAPRATVGDCANLLIAVNANGCTVKDAPQAIKTYRQLELHTAHGGQDVRQHAVEFRRIEREKLRFLDRRDATFGDMLEAIIDRFIGGELEAFMLEEASRYVRTERVRAELGDDEDAIQKHIIDSARRLLRLGIVTFDVRFYRPSPYAELGIARSVGPTKETLAGANFLLAEPIKDYGGDRRDVTTIGCATFLKVAEVMRQ